MLLWNVGRLRDFSKSSCHQTICQLCGADEGKNSRPFFFSRQLYTQVLTRQKTEQAEEVEIFNDQKSVMFSSFSSFLNLVTQKFSNFHLLNSANISSIFEFLFSRIELLRVTKTFSLSEYIPCFHKSAKVSVMNIPYKRPNNFDLLFIDLGLC